ncbi:hypothetical protein GCM10027418_31390 [Mariniluteicoccus endophyticus]
MTALSSRASHHGYTTMRDSTDLGPGAGDDGGTVVAAGTPAQVADNGVGASAEYLAAAIKLIDAAT